MVNTWYNRPDLKPYPAMVPKESMDITERTALEAHSRKFRNERHKDEKKKSTWYRLLFPNSADYNVKENPYAIHPKENVYNPKNGYFASYTNRFRDHHQD